MTPRTYILQLFSFAVIISCAVLAMNYFIDPYGITGSPRIDGLNRYKTDINNYVRLSKRYQPLQQEYDALIVGNSRVEMGINPGHECFMENSWRVYNLGIPGAGVRQQLEYALNLIYQQPIKKLWLGVDFSDFVFANPDKQEKRPGLVQTSENSLRYLPSGAVNPDYLATKTLDFYRALFSLDALISSISTLAGQGEPTTDRDIRGFNTAHDFAQSVQIEGPRALFDQKMSRLRKQYSRQLYLRTQSGRLGQSFNDLSQFLAIAHEQGVDVTVFINPFHQAYWALLKQEGMLGLYEEWTREIVSLIKAQGNSTVTLWDFSRDSNYIHETVPERGRKSGPLQWFWEPAHYRAELGELMVDTMLADHCAREAVFGARLI